MNDDDDMYAQEAAERRESRKIWAIAVAIVLTTMAAVAWDASRGGCNISYLMDTTGSRRFGGSERRDRAWERYQECRDYWNATGGAATEMTKEERVEAALAHEKSRIADTAAGRVRAACRAGHYKSTWPPLLANLAQLAEKTNLTAKFCDCVGSVHGQRMENLVFDAPMTEDSLRTYLLAPERITQDLAATELQEDVDRCIRPSIMVRTGKDP